MTLTPKELQRLIDEPIYSWDVCGLLSGIVDFLEFSENNLQSQRQREVRRARREAAALDFGPGDNKSLQEARRYIIESAELRFDIGLSQRVRYAGLIAYISAIEWCMKLFRFRLTKPHTKPPRGKNEAVHTLQHLDGLVGNRWAVEAATLEHTVFIRNCIVHATGLVRGWKFEKEIRRSVAALHGFSVSNMKSVEDEIQISAGAVDELAKRALVWVPALDKECSESGVFRK